ncbi:hypothetical protein DSO05_05185 [Candidatus Nezhaarchaeota archaeon WYZ-LMO7]|nr:MAG: hypothetical protein DSO05_05185 [Candidatus Nezhaarchaeota archaeon WYZ-LMO7]
MRITEKSPIPCYVLKLSFIYGFVTSFNKFFIKLQYFSISLEIVVNQIKMLFYSVYQGIFWKELYSLTSFSLLKLGLLVSSNVTEALVFNKL